MNLLLKVSEIPVELAGKNTWNCSVPHWPRFQRHFRCNLRQECVQGEDEIQCPYSRSQEGVSFGHRSYFFVTRGDDVSWAEGQSECRKAGAHLASLTSPRIWSDVMSWLHLGLPWLTFYRVYIGLKSVPPSLPYMWVKDNYVQLIYRANFSHIL